MRNAAVLRDQLVAAARGERPLLEAIAAYEEDMRAATYPLMELASDHGRFGGGGLRRPEDRRGPGMRVLGLGAGNPGGSAEILLQVALAAAADEGADIALVRLDDLALPTRPVGPPTREAARTTAPGCGTR